jgi:hypothetical protein
MSRALTLLALGLALAGCEAGHSPGRDGTETVPKAATYGDCPLAEIDGKLVELGDSCQYLDGELVAVHLTGGWVTAE